MMGYSRWCPVSRSRWDLRWAMHGLRKSGRRCATPAINFVAVKDFCSILQYLFFSRGPHGNSFTGNRLSMKWFEMTWRDECNDSWEKVDFIFDRSSSNALDCVSWYSILAWWQFNNLWNRITGAISSLSSVSSWQGMLCHVVLWNLWQFSTDLTIAPLFGQWRWPWWSYVFLDLYLACWLFLEVSEFCWAFLAPPKASYWSRRSSWVSPTSRTGMGGGYLFCCRVLGKRSSAPRVCLYNQ